MTPLLVHPYKKNNSWSSAYSTVSIPWSPQSPCKNEFLLIVIKNYEKQILKLLRISNFAWFSAFIFYFFTDIFSRIVDVFFIVGLRARGQADLDTTFFIRFPEALWFCNRMWPANTSYSYTTNAMVQFGGFHHFRHHNLIWLTMKVNFWHRLWVDHY